MTGCAEIHHRHRDVTGGRPRPAVFGGIDGPVSDVALIAGVAGGTSKTKIIPFAGVVLGNLIGASGL